MAVGVVGLESGLGLSMLPPKIAGELYDILDW
jgi:hypothetical protein